MTTPAAARLIFGAGLAQASRYVELLAGPAVDRGLLGPREIDRLWERHLLNCAALAELIPSGAAVLDVGSGAGLPGIALALARPDLSITLLEPMARRVAFLEEAVGELRLSTVSVVRGRAEDIRTGPNRYDVVTARAVAGLDRLIPWCLPLLRPGGALLAMKGASAAVELAAAAPGLRDSAAGAATVLTCGEGLLPVATTVVRVYAPTNPVGKHRRQ